MGRHKLTLSDGSVLRLYLQTVEDFGLFEGMELEAETLKKLKTAAGQMSAKMRAVRILSAASVSEQDLRQRLVRKGERAEDARDAVQWLEEMHLVDDRETARQIVARCIRQGYGPARAKQALYEKRIPREYWAAALEDYPEQLDAIVEFLKNRLDSDRDIKAVRKATDALIRRGHSYSQIRKGLELLNLDNELPEEF